MKNGLQELFLDELADIHHAEKQLTKALPKLIKAAESDELRDAFESHLRETEEHARRVEQVFEAFGESPKRKKCKGMQGIVEEGDEMLSEFGGTPSGDAALIAAAQKAEHYEMASYGCLCTWARLMNNTDAANLLQENLEEEKEADRKLTEIAESMSNVDAVETSDEG